MNKKQKKVGTKTIVLALILVAAITSMGCYALWRSMNSSETAINKDVRSLKKYLNQGPGMNPTLTDGQEIYGKVVAASEVMRGDIIVFNSPTGQSERLVKRVIGLPGDTVNVQNGMISVVLPEGTTYSPDLPKAQSTLNSSKFVSADTFFVVGDNVNNSLDSRLDAFGLVPFSSLQSVIIQ